jgi:hypothetical protein
MEDNLEKLLKSLEADGLIQASVNYKGKKSEYERVSHESEALEQKENELYIQALEFATDREIEKAINRLEELLVFEPNHKKGKEFINKLKKTQLQIPNLNPLDTKSDRTQDIKNGKKKRRSVNSLPGLLSFFIILLVGFFLGILVYRTDYTDHIAILPGFITSYIFTYVGFYYEEKIKRGINGILNLKMGKQLLVILLVFTITIIFVLPKYLLKFLGVPGDYLGHTIFFGFPPGFVIGCGLAALLKEKS